MVEQHSEHPMVTVNGVRYRAEDAQTRGLLPDPEHADVTGAGAHSPEAAAAAIAAAVTAGAELAHTEFAGDELGAGEHQQEGAVATEDAESTQDTEERQDNAQDAAGRPGAGAEDDGKGAGRPARHKARQAAKEPRGGGEPAAG